MNTKRIMYWGIFIIVVGLIVWGMIAAANKASKNGGYIPLPDQILSSDWIKGNPLAKVTMVEYSDFQCPACAAYHPLVSKLVAENIVNIKFVYRHFPLPQHPNAMPAAKASEAAGKQGKFWEMQDMIFETHDEWEDVKDVERIFTGYAEKLGLDMKKYSVDFESKEIIDKINTDIKSGERARIDSTPTFYINGKKITNPRSYEEFRKIIDEAINTTNQS